MKIGIDTFCCDHGRSGIGAYITSLIKNLPKDPSFQFDLFGSEMDRYTFDSDNENTTYSGITVMDSEYAEKLWHVFRMKKFAKKNCYDAILYPAGARVMPVSFKVPGIAVVQDIFSNTINHIDNVLLRYSMKLSLKNATKIIVASQYVRKDLISMGYSSDKIEVIHNGIDHSLFYQHNELDSDTVVIKPFAIKRPYFIYASRIHCPLKRHIELIKAFSLFKKKTGLPHRLVLAGSDGFQADLVHKEAAMSDYASDIFLTGYFPHDSLPELYSCADACIFPSTSEGVGLPIIEAMATGIPVVCAKAGSLTEIAGDNALYFDATNITEIADCMQTIVEDTKLREKLSKTGFEWVKRFSWEKTAQKTIEVIKSAIDERK